MSGKDASQSIRLLPSKYIESFVSNYNVMSWNSDIMVYFGRHGILFSIGFIRDFLVHINYTYTFDGGGYVGVLTVADILL